MIIEMKYLTNQRFGDLLVLDQAPKIEKDHHIAWLCKCDCGNTIVVRGFQLTSGKKTHCGCQTKSNIIDIIGKRFGRLTVIESAGLDKYNNALWLCKCDCGEEVTKKGVTLRDGRTQSCGCLKLEMNATDMPERRKKDNVEGTSLGRIQSKSIPINNTSGYKGVSRHSQLDKWVATISFQGKRIYLGLFDELDEAIEAREKAEEFYFLPVIKKYSK